MSYFGEGREARPDRSSPPDSLRILIVSTGRTGNNWIEALLATLYNLPIVQVRGVWRESSFLLDPEEVRALGPRWIAHQHFHPHPDLLEWAHEPGVHLITTIRHPGDVLVSLFHYALSETHDPLAAPALRAYLSAPLCEGRAAPMLHEYETDIATFVREWFHGELAVSLGWLQCGASYPVRYEDLWLDPVTALRDLTVRIRAVTSDVIERAAAQCEIGLMRSLAGDHTALFRKGGIGGWRSALPAGIVDLFRHLPPYPSQFAALGYSLDRDDPRYALSPRPLSIENPFQHVTHFDNGVPVPPIVVRLFLGLDSAVRARWRSVGKTAPGSFHAWLNAPAADDPGGGHAAPRITNLMAYLYRTRFDVQSLYPDVFQRDRTAFLTWYCELARTEYSLDDAFVAPIRDGLRAWHTAAGPTGRTMHDPRRANEHGAIPGVWRWAGAAVRRFATHHPEH